MQLNINTDEIVIHANRLEKMSRTALPNAIRGTLNSLAFDVKKNTMPEQVQKEFDVRKKTFFKSNSTVEMARGSNVYSMKSTIGFVAKSKGSEDAIDNLEVQERGGRINDRQFIPTEEARTSKSMSRTVARRNQLRNIKGVAKVSQAKGKTQGQKFIKTVVHVGKGGVLMTEKSLIRVKSIKRLKSGQWKFKLRKIYDVEKGRDVRVNATHFMEKATKKTMKKEVDLFEKQANRELNKLR